MELRGSVTSATAQGLRRHQEDRFLVQSFASRELRGYLLAVLDGHDGSRAADVCLAAIPELFVLAVPEDLEASLRRVVAGLDRQTRGMTSGSTVSLACILESHGRAAIAVLGDSPVVAVDRGGEMVLSPSHNVRSNPEERREGERRGGVFRGGYLTNPATGYGLQMARALGDRLMGEILSREPTVYTIEIGARSVVVLASDGLLDPDHAEVARLAEEMLGLRSRGAPFDAETLIGWAQERGLFDNATAVVWNGVGGDTGAPQVSTSTPSSSMSEAPGSPLHIGTTPRRPRIASSRPPG